MKILKGLGKALYIGQFSKKIRVPFGVLFIRVPYYVGDLKRDPGLENYTIVGLCKYQAKKSLP